MTDEQLACFARRNLLVIDLATGLDRQTEQRCPLVDGNPRRAAFPVRFIVLLAHQVHAYRFDPLGLNLGHHARPDFAGLHLFAAHDPLRPAFELSRSGMNGQLVAARTQVFALFFLLADVGQQPRQKSAVDSVVICALVVERQLQLALEHGDNLRVYVVPFAHAQIRHKVFFAPTAQLGFRQLRALRFVFDPQLQQRQKVRVLMLPKRVLLVGLGFLVGWAVAWVRHAQCCHDHRHFGQAALFGGRQQHATQPRIHRQCGESVPQRCERVVGRERAQLLQRALAIADIATVRRLHKGKAFNITQTQRMHLQDHCGQIGALYFRISEGRSACKVVFAIQAYGDARANTAATPRALIGRSLRDLLDGQSLQSAAVTVAADARMAGIDHCTNARHGERCFGNVGRQHDASLARRPKHAFLLSLR